MSNNSSKQENESRMRKQISSCKEMKEENETLLMTFNENPLFKCRTINLIYGLTASAKSSLAHCMAATFLRPDRFFKELNLRNKLSKDISVLWLDSELFPNEFAKAKDKIVGLSGTQPECNRFTPYRMLATTSEDKITELENLIQLVTYDFPEDHIVIIIDTITDLVSNFNNVDETEAITKKLLSIVDKTQCTIICVMHETKSAQKAMGHLGSSLERKSSSILKTKTYYNGYYIENLKNRAAKEFGKLYVDFSEGATHLKLIDRSRIVKEARATSSRYSFTEEQFYAAFMSLAIDGVLQFKALRAKLPSLLNCSERTIRNFFADLSLLKYKYSKSGKNRNIIVSVSPN